MSKRVRTDGHLSKETYSPSAFGGMVLPTGSTPPKAPSMMGQTSLGNRRVVKVKKSSSTRPLTAEYLRHMQSLNASFLSHILAAPQGGTFTEPCLDYLSYVGDLAARYQQGERTSILTFGSGDCGQLAHGIEEDNELMCKRPRAVLDLHTVSIVRVGAGGLHNVAVTSSGDCYTWGCNDDGSVGRPGVEHQPMIVEGLGRVENGDAGDCQTVVVGGGKVYGWGAYKDKEGKCFREAWKESEVRGKLTEPGLVNVSGVTDVKCGASFNVATTDNGGAVSWGLGECGELGRKVGPMKDGENYNLGRILREHLTPQPVIFEGVKQKRFVRKVAAGAYHVMVVTIEGEEGGSLLWTSGLNNYGQLGLGDINNRTVLTPVEALVGERVEQIDGGMHHSLCLTKEGGLYAFGRGDSGQLGVKDDCEVGYCEMSPVPGASRLLIVLCCVVLMLRLFFLCVWLPPALYLYCTLRAPRTLTHSYTNLLTRATQFGYQAMQRAFRNRSLVDQITTSLPPPLTKCTRGVTAIC